MVCTKTLYNYIDLGLLPIKNFDPSEKLRPNTKAKRVRESKFAHAEAINESLERC